MSAKAKKNLTEAEITKRTAETKAAAGRALAKTEKLNIRFTEEEILRIQELAARKKERVMPMMRNWVTAALKAEEEAFSKPEATGSSVAVLPHAVAPDTPPSELIHNALVQLTRALGAAGYRTQDVDGLTSTALRVEEREPHQHPTSKL